MKVAIIGRGNVGSTLGSGFRSAGHEVWFGVRQPEEVSDAISIEEAISRGEVVLLATPWKAAGAIVANHPALAGKTIVDCTNPIGPGFELAVGHSTSGIEELAKSAPDAHFVKAFNTTGFENMANPDYAGQALTMFLCGDHAESNEKVAQLCRDIGFDPLITGPLRHARYLEPLAMLWIEMALKYGHGRSMGLKMLNR